MSNDLILSLGSNIEPKKDYLILSIIKLNEVFKLNKISSLYLSEPLEDIYQENFLNLCVSYFSDIDNPFKILKIINNIEVEIGRKKDINRPKGPRIIDIDIIFFDDIEIRTEDLTIPHKSLFNRKFVLKPLIDILSKDSIYITKYQLKKHLKKNEKQNVNKIGELII